MKYTHLLFDLDNTLLDFSASSLHALKDFAEILHVHYDKDFLDVYHNINHTVWTEFEHGIIDATTLRRKRFELTASHYGRKVDGLLINRRYMKGLVEHTHFVDGAQEVLNSLKQDHRLSIITNGLKEVQRPRLKAAGIYELFETIVVSDEIGLAKPDQAYFQYAWESIKMPDKAKVLVIGDNPNSDISGATNFGFDSCLFDPLDMKEQGNATYKVTDLREILQIVAGD